MGGTIVNADSAQVYSGSAHHLRPTLGRKTRPGRRTASTAIAIPRRPCSAADWAADAKRAIAEAQAGGRLPILAGGTGLYIRTLLDGIAPVPEIDPAIREGGALVHRRS